MQLWGGAVYIGKVDLSATDDPTFEPEMGYPNSFSTLFLDFRDGPHVFTRVYEGQYGKRAKV